MKFKNGEKLSSVVGPPNDGSVRIPGQVFYTTHKGVVSRHRATSITIVMQNGQMAEVPWARVEKENGGVIMVNLALMEEVELETT